MKSLELNINKRLLIVEDAEYGSYFPPRSVGYHIEKDGEVWKLLCKGLDLTEDIAKRLVDLHENGYYKDYKNDNNFFTLPSKSFISAIESKRWFWEDTIKCINTGAFRSWQEAESRTFNPEKCLIFDIV